MTPQEASAKIRKMLALARDAGATEEEADTALKMASAMALKFGIDMELAQVEYAGPNVVRVDIGEFTGYIANWSNQCLSAVQYMYGVQSIMSQRGNRTLFYMLGTDDVIDAAKMTFEYLVEQIDDWYKKYRPKGMTQRERAEYRKTFKFAAAQRVNQRAMEFRQLIITDDATASRMTGHNALTVKDHFAKRREQTVEFMRNEGIHLRAARARTHRVGRGTMDGTQAGNRVQLNRSLT